ncbi:MAG: DUF87 domain-containing protein [Myxococcales bacterium]|nr:DUF87 domain-containing protein [Myxococcales bacterium]MCB9581536.1 DUF87 domain-containing protein [Polyangiaceae bacterium]
MLQVPRGHLFLGAEIDPATKERLPDRVFLDSSRLTTHGVVVGMTGSGKTGLGVVLLEEALLSDVPTLILDPKGDMGNLLLHFPELSPESFRPWIDEDAARRDGMDPDAAAQKVAESWKQGLESWDIRPGRIRAMDNSAVFSIFTPGSSAGAPLSILGSPVSSTSRDVESVRDEIEAFVSSLLRLASIEADPLSSPEHVLLATLLENAWRDGRTLDVGALVLELLDPPLRRVGVFEVDAFYPKKEREKLARRLNTLLASPSFASWLEGPPLDIGALLYTPEGKPRASILYLAHLSDDERQFVVTLVLSKLVTWMRGQPGTSNLRALVYMDEVFGYAPPTASPPSKKPILTLLKQARAFGVGLVLATQNPVDLDYKAMSNAGTWLVGRLQTERDKERIVEGLRSAGGGIDVAELSARIGALDKRQYVLHQTGEPLRLLTTRWAMSYLRGPLTRDDVRRLSDGTTGIAPPAPAPTSTAAAPAPATPVSGAWQPPAPPPATEVVSGAWQPPAPPAPGSYADPGAPWLSTVGGVPGGRVLAPAAVFRVGLVFDEARADLRHEEELEAVLFPLGDSFDTSRLTLVDYDDRDFRPEPPAGTVFAQSAAPILDAKYFDALSKALMEHLYRTRTVTIFANKELGLYSRPGEDLGAFQARAQQAADERANQDAAKLRDKYASRIDKLRDQIQTAQQKAADARFAASQRSRQATASGVGELVGLLVGGRSSAKNLARMAVRGSGSSKDQRRAEVADQRANDKLTELAALEAELRTELEQIGEAARRRAQAIETLDVKLERDDIQLRASRLAWLPAG